MKSTINHRFAFTAILLLFTFCGCKKEKSPTVFTIQVTGVTETAAIIGGDITDSGSSEVISSGVCWSTGSNPSIADDKTTDGISEGSYQSVISGLTMSRNYFVRAYAQNAAGIGYGNILEFTTRDKSLTETMTDIDGNIYNTVTIGDQVWMQENLKTTRYGNGDLILTTANQALDITFQTTPKYQWSCDVALNGRFYTYYAITDSRNLCPEGWHVPADDEWITLTDYLSNNGYGYNGNPNFIAKAMAATSGWIADTTTGNVGNEQLSNNSSGFSGLSSGGRYSNGIVHFVGLHGIWWSATESISTEAYFRCIGYLPARVFKGVFPKSYGLPVRCIKNI